MNDYDQPDFYRFSEDSTLLARFITENQKQYQTLLDICAGCGVVGIEIGLKMSSMSKIDFVELQTDFIPYLDKNCSDFLKPNQFKIYQESFLNFRTNQTYDLIVCNPPYFQMNNSRPNKDQRRDLCRRLVTFELEELIHYFKEFANKGSDIFFTYLNTYQFLDPMIKEEKQVSQNVSIFSMKKDNIL